MFEYDNDIVANLLVEDKTFKHLFDKHNELKRKVRDANTGKEALDDVCLENLKKEKLLLKDRMAVMIENYRRTHA